MIHLAPGPYVISFLDTLNCSTISSVIREKGESRVLQKNKTRQIFRKTNISYPLIRTLVFTPRRLLWLLWDYTTFSNKFLRWVTKME